MKSTVFYQGESILQYIRWGKLCRAASLQKGINVVEQEINPSPTTPEPCRDITFSLGCIPHSWTCVALFFQPVKPYTALFFSIHSSERVRGTERAVLGEKGVVGECQGEIREENAWEREQIPIKEISLLPWCMNELAIMTALHASLQCSGLNAAKEAMAQAVLWES